MEIYSIRSLTRAKSVADLIEKSVKTDGIELRRSKALELTARLMGYADWTALVIATKNAPCEGKEDFELSSDELDERVRCQVEILVTQLSVTDDVAMRILRQIKPTGRDGADSMSEVLSHQHELGLTTDDEELLDRLVLIAKEVGAGARSVLRHVPLDGIEIRPDREPVVPTLCEELPKIAFEFRRAHTGSEAIAWEKAKVGDAFEAAAAAEIEAIVACKRLVKEFGRLGPVPFLSPIQKFEIGLCRMSRKHLGRGTYADPIEIDPFFEMFWHAPNMISRSDVCGPAKHAFAKILGLRRAFLDGGWTPGGEVWMVTFRDRGGSKITLPVIAPDAGKAVAWICAAESAKYTLEQDRKRKFRIVMVEGPEGQVSVDHAVALAKLEPITNGPLLSPEQIAVPARVSPVPDVNWEVIQDGTARAILIQPKDDYRNPHIVVIRDDLDGLMFHIGAPQNADMGLLRKMATNALNGEPPLETTKTADESRDIAVQAEAWSDLLRFMTAA